MKNQWRIKKKMNSRIIVKNNKIIIITQVSKKAQKTMGITKVVQVLELINEGLIRLTQMEEDKIKIHLTSLTKDQVTNFKMIKMMRIIKVICELAKSKQEYLQVPLDLH